MSLLRFVGARLAQAFKIIRSDIAGNVFARKHRGIKPGQRRIAAFYGINQVIQSLINKPFGTDVFLCATSSSATGMSMP